MFTVIHENVHETAVKARLGGKEAAYIHAAYTLKLCGLRQTSESL